MAKRLHGVLGLIMVLCLTTMATVSTVYADENPPKKTPEEIEAEKKAFDKALADLQTTIDQTKKAIDAAKAAVAKLKDKESVDDVIDALGGPKREDYADEAEWVAELLVWYFGLTPAQQQRYDDAIANEEALAKAEEELAALIIALSVFERSKAEKEAEKKAHCDLHDGEEGGGGQD